MESDCCFPAWASSTAVAEKMCVLPSPLWAPATTAGRKCGLGTRCCRWHWVEHSGPSLMLAGCGGAEWWHCCWRDDSGAGIIPYLRSKGRRGIKLLPCYYSPWLAYLGTSGGQVCSCVVLVFAESASDVYRSEWKRSVPSLGIAGSSVIHLFLQEEERKGWDRTLNGKVEPAKLFVSCPW